MADEIVHFLRRKPRRKTPEPLLWFPRWRRRVVQLPFFEAEVFDVYGGCRVVVTGRPRVTAAGLATGRYRY